MFNKSTAARVVFVGLSTSTMVLLLSQSWSISLYATIVGIILAFSFVTTAYSISMLLLSEIIELFLLAKFGNLFLTDGIMFIIFFIIIYLSAAISVFAEKCSKGGGGSSGESGWSSSGSGGWSGGGGGWSGGGGFSGGGGASGSW